MTPMWITWWWLAVAAAAVTTAVVVVVAVSYWGQPVWPALLML
jgi:hypothetical protein